MQTEIILYEEEDFLESLGRAKAPAIVFLEHSEFCYEWNYEDDLAKCLGHTPTRGCNKNAVRLVGYTKPGRSHAPMGLTAIWTANGFGEYVRKLYCEWGNHETFHQTLWNDPNISPETKLLIPFYHLVGVRTDTNTGSESESFIRQQ